MTDCKEHTLTKEQADIIQHTLYRAAGGRYCGDSIEMQELVKWGLMKSLGRCSFVPDEYFGVTSKGREALAGIER